MVRLFACVIYVYVLFLCVCECEEEHVVRVKERECVNVVHSYFLKIHMYVCGCA